VLQSARPTDAATSRPIRYRFVGYVARAQGLASGWGEICWRSSVSWPAISARHTAAQPAAASPRDL